MTVRSKRLFGPTRIGTTDPVVLATVPGGQRWIVKSIRVNNLSTDPHTFALYIGDPPADGVVFEDAETKGGDVVSDTSWFIVDQGEEVRFVADAADVFSIMASGADLTL